MKDKFISSLSSLILYVSLIIIMLTIALSSIVVFFITEGQYKMVYLFPFVFGFVVAIIIFLVMQKSIYWVEVYHDRFIFKSILKKDRLMLFEEVKSIYKLTNVMRKGPFYIFTIEENEDMSKLLKLTYPFKFDSSKRTDKIVKDFLNKPVKMIDDLIL